MAHLLKTAKGKIAPGRRKSKYDDSPSIRLGAWPEVRPRFSVNLPFGFHGQKSAWQEDDPIAPLRFRRYSALASRWFSNRLRAESTPGRQADHRGSCPCWHSGTARTVAADFSRTSF